jgi:hypothetical protein
MGSHPINLMVRFLLEITGLVALGLFGWQFGNGVYRYLLSMGLPLTAAIIWGTFSVPDDPSRSGNAVVQIPGIVRLSLELAFFISAIGALIAIDSTNLAWVYAGVALIHHFVSGDRLLWLIRQ